MPIRVEGLQGNTLDVSEDFLQHQNGLIKFIGKGGLFRAGNLSRAADISIMVGDHCSVIVGEDCHLSILTVYTQKRSSVIIGNGVAITWDCQISCHESYNVRIGDGCLIAPQTFISVSDMHTIYDTVSGKRLNQGSDITIGNHVWIGAGSSILKGVTIGDGSVVGLGSIVTKSVGRNVAIAGIPAKTIRKNVSWHHSLDWQEQATAPVITPKMSAFRTAIKAFFLRQDPLRSL